MCIETHWEYCRRIFFFFFFFFWGTLFLRKLYLKNKVKNDRGSRAAINFNQSSKAPAMTYYWNRIINHVIGWMKDVTPHGQPIGLVNPDDINIVINVFISFNFTLNFNISFNWFRTIACFRLLLGFHYIVELHVGMQDDYESDRWMADQMMT